MIRRKTITISVTPEIHAQMAGVVGVNWSAIARQAFQDWINYHRCGPELGHALADLNRSCQLVSIALSERGGCVSIQEDSDPPVER